MSVQVPVAVPVRTQEQGGPKAALIVVAPRYWSFSTLAEWLWSGVLTDRK